MILPSTYTDCFSEEEKKYIHFLCDPIPKLDSFPGHYIRENVCLFGCRFFEAERNAPLIYLPTRLVWNETAENKEQIKIRPELIFHGLEMFQMAADLRSKAEQFLFRKPV